MLEFILSYITVQGLMWVVVALPMGGFVVNGLISLISTQYNQSEPRSLVVFISQGTVVLSFAAIILLWYILYGLEGASPSVITGPLFSWKGFVNQPLTFGLKADQLSLSIVFIVAFVGVAAHFYSIGYVAKEKRVAGYFALLNLVFSFALLLLLTDSFFFFFVVWQMMSVAGFIFISRYFTDRRGIRTASIYYISETVSGSAFLLVMILVWKAFQAHVNINLDIFQFSSIQIGANLLLPYADIICFAILISIIVRSLQFPFYMWLPEATKTQVPVFAYMYSVLTVLIATYLLIRLNFLLVLSPKILTVIAYLGGIGSLSASVAAVVQKETKKVVAYFVISSMGLALIGVGVGAFAAAVFHVFTYAVYISALILGLGSVINTVGFDYVDEVRGLRKYLPVTFWVTLIAALSATGIYPLAGFFGRIGIVWEAYQRGHGLLFLAAFFSGIFGAIALFRLIALIFFGKFDRSKIKTKRLEESSVSMLVAMVLLGFASIVIGWFGVREAFGGGDYFEKWLEPGLATQMVHVIGSAGRFSELVLAVVTTLFVAHAGFVTWIVYVQKRKWPASLAVRFPRIYKLLENGFYLNRLYEVAFARPFNHFSEWVLWKGLDRLIINGVLVGGVDRIVALSGEIIEKLRVKSLAALIFLVVVGLIVLIGWSVF